MRDKKRIRRILTKLEKVWLKCSDMRLGQLVNNIGLDFNIEDERDPKWTRPTDRIAEEEIEKFGRMISGKIKKKVRR